MTQMVLMSRPGAGVQSVPEGGAHAVPGAPLPVHPGPARGLLGLPLLQPAQHPPREALSTFRMTLYTYNMT